MAKRRTLTFALFLVFALSLCLFTASFAMAKQALAEEQWTTTDWVLSEEDGEEVYTATGDSSTAHDLTLNSIGENNKITFDFRLNNCTGERNAYFNFTIADNQVLSLYLWPKDECMYIYLNDKKLAGVNHASVSANGWNTVTIELYGTYATFNYANTTATGVYGSTIDFTNASLTFTTDRILPSIKNFNMEKVEEAQPEKPKTDFEMVGWDITKQGEDILYYTTGEKADTHTMTLNSVGENNKIKFLISRGNCSSECYVNFVLTAADGNTLKMSFRFDCFAVYIHYNGNRLDGQNHDGVSEGGFNEATMEFYKGHAVFSFVDVNMNQTYRFADSSLALADFTNAKLTIEADRMLPSIKNLALTKVTEAVGNKTELNALITTVKALKAADYTTATFEKLATPLEKAEALAENVTQDEVNYAYQELNVAYEALEEKQAPDTDSSTDSGSASDSGSTTDSGATTNTDSGSQTEEKTGCFGGIETTSVMLFMLGMVAVYAIIKRRKTNA